jgi:hypothetical protein
MSDGKRRILTGVVAAAVIGYGGWAWYFASPVQPLAKAIRYGDRDEKSTALHQLPQVVATPADVELAIAVLFDALKDPNLEIRAEAAESIRELYSNRQRNLEGAGAKNTALDARAEVVRQALLGAVGDPEAYVRQQSLRAFSICGKADPDAIPPSTLLAMLDDPSESVRAASMEVIVAYDKAMGALLKVGLKHYPSEGVEARTAFQSALVRGRFRAEHLPDLLTTLSSTDMDLQHSGMLGLAAMGPEARSAIPAVTECIRRALDLPRRPPGSDNFDPDLVRTGLRTLVQLSPRDAPASEVVTFLREFLTMPKATPWNFFACYELACLGEEARSAIADVLRVFETIPVGAHGRYQATRSLAHLAKGTDMQPRVLDALVKAWKAHPDSKIEPGVYEALIELRPDSEKLLPEVREFKGDVYLNPYFKR